MDVAPNIRLQIAEIASLMGESFEDTNKLLNELREQGVVKVGHVKGRGPVLKLAPDAHAAVERFLELHDEGPEAL